METGAISEVGAGADALAAATNKSDRVTKDAFLQLLVAQLQAQDPLNPTSNEEFLGQLAQLQSLEETSDLNKNMTELTTSINQNLSGLMHSQQLFSAAAMMGANVRAQGPDGILGGQVTKVNVIDGAVKLTIQDSSGDKSVDLSDVIEITGV